MPPIEQPIPLGMSLDSFALPQDRAFDQVPEDSMLAPQVDEDDVKQVVMEQFQNDVKDKEEWGWLEKQEYNLRAYYGIKDAAMMNRPWPGASAYPVPITPTLLDTGHANIKASMRSKDGRWVTVEGVGEEDIRKAVPLESLLNWQLTNQVPFDKVQDHNIFRTLVQGNGVLKVMQNFSEDGIKIVSLDLENIYCPIDAEGVQFGDNHGHFTQIIPLSKNDIEMRKYWGVYDNLDQVMPGARISSSRNSGSDYLQKMKDYVTGTNKEQRMNRETYFMAETYLEYFPKSGMSMNGGGPSRVGVKPTYLIVWWSPNGGAIHRIATNPEKVVPFANHDLYPQPGYFFSMSLPEKIRNIQEKANYADKQNTDAMDRAISPAMFVEDSSELEKSRAKRIPGGVYNLGKDQRIQYEPMPTRERGFEVEIQRMWLEAQQMTGLIDVSYGGKPGDQTLGQTQIRSFRADIRFADIFERYSRGLKETLDLIYHYDNKFMPRDTKVKVIGYADYKTIDELFPNPSGGDMGLGHEGKFDFSFAGSAITDRETNRQNAIAFYSTMLTDPVTASNPRDNWNVKERLAEEFGIRNVETILTKPSQAMNMTPHDFVQRVVSGQTGLDLRPDIDVDGYIFEIESFMRKETFLALRPELKEELLRGLKLSYVMRAAQMQAIMDVRTVNARQQAIQAASVRQGQGNNGRLQPGA